MEDEKIKPWSYWRDGNITNWRLKNNIDIPEIYLKALGKCDRLLAVSAAIIGSLITLVVLHIIGKI